MSCTSPRKVWNIGLKPNGKKDIIFSDYNVHHLELRNGKYIKCYDSKLSGSCEKPIYDFIEVPCGKCLSCRLTYSKHWADRCLMEMQYHHEAYFLTLTYDDDHLPKIPKVDFDSGEILEGEFNNTLKKEDLQSFIKRLRKYEDKYFNKKIRFFACGEYGSTTYRPHYHIIVFGLHLEDLKDVGSSNVNDSMRYYESPILNQLWSNGFVTVARASYETCAYVSRYVSKKANSNIDEFISTIGCEKEFITMSRRPGIGYDYYIDHTDLFDYQFINLSTDTGGKKVSIPRYFFKQLEKDDTNKYDYLKEKRSLFAKINVSNIKRSNEKSYIGVLKSRDLILKNKTKSLERSKI